MSATNNPRPHNTPVQPELSTLLARYLQRQAEAHALGLASADSSGDVAPYEVGPVQPIDAKPAWEEAIAAIQYYADKIGPDLQAPPQWPYLVSNSEPSTALPFCLGNFPQLVRNLQAMLQAKNLQALRPVAGRPVHAPQLIEWARAAAAASAFPRLLLALGALRLAKQFDVADEIVAAGDVAVPAQWQTAWANEKAALAWQRGHCEDALAMWQSMPQGVPQQFNRGMAALFCGHTAEARTHLEQAVAQLPETRAWHHLGRLYLTLLADSERQAS
jgi:hypothetical protein